MEQNDLHQLIEQQAAEQKKTLYAKYGEEAKRCVEENAKARQRRKRMAIHISALAASFLVVAICLTVILTVVTNNNGNVIQYDGNDIKTRQTATTLKEYGEIQTDKILYLDWYNTVPVFETIEAYDSNDKVIYIRERFFVSTENTVTLVVMKNIYEVNSFERYNSLSDNCELSNGVTLTYSIKNNDIEAKFEYEGYKYFLNFCGTTDAEYVKTTVESMFD